MTLLEIMVAMTILVIVIILFMTMWNEAMDMSRSQVVEAELRARAQFALDRIANDLRSTNTSSTFVLTTTATSSQHAVSFYLITTTDAAGLPVHAPVATLYSWDPTKTTSPGSDWNLSQILVTTYDVFGKKGVPQTVLIGGVTGFSVQPLDANGQVTTPLPLDGKPHEVLVTLEVSRKHVFQNAKNPTRTPPKEFPYLNSNGALTVTLTTNVTVPGGQ